jgi:hypothetical protein
MAVLYFAFFTVLCLSAWMTRRDASRALFRAALVVSALPYLLLIWYLWRWIYSYGPPADAPNGSYPGLVAFGILGVTVTLGFLAVALRHSERWPGPTGLLPIALGATFRYALFPVLYWRVPGALQFDNMPLIWLAAFSGFASLLLIPTGALALSRGSTRTS